MSATDTTITIKIDASSGISSLQKLRTAITGVGTAARGLGTGSGLSALAGQVSTTASGFQRLAQSIGLASSAAQRLSATAGGGAIGGLAKSTAVASKEMGGLSSAFAGASKLAAALGIALGGMGLSRFAGDVQKNGNAILSFKISLDAVATSASESGDQLKFLRNLAETTGGSFGEMIPSYQRLAVSMRALGRPVQEIQTVFRGFQVALTSMHVPIQDQKMALLELAETYAQGAIHSRQALLAMGSHIPGMSALLQEALGKTGEQMHKMFAQGGLPLETWLKVADILDKRFSSQIPEALKHSTAQIALFNTTLTEMEQAVFSGGFDTGLTTFLKEVNLALKTAGIEDFGATLGRVFREGAVLATMFVKTIIDLRVYLSSALAVLVGFPVAALGFRLLAAAVTTVMSPLGLLAIAAGLLFENWNAIKTSFADGAAFQSASDYIKRISGGLLDLVSAARGAVGAWTFLRDILGGAYHDDAGKHAVDAMAAFDPAAATQAGGSYAKNFADGAKDYFSQIGALFSASLTNPDANPAVLKRTKAEYDRLMAASDPKNFQGAGDYSGNAAKYAKPNNDLSEELKKEYERLLPANKALTDYRDALESISKMKGKLSPLTGELINADEIKKMTAAARESVMKDAFPVANKISELVDNLKLEQEALKNVESTNGAKKDNAEALKEEKEYLKFRNEMKKKGIDLTNEETAALKALIKAEAELGKDKNSNPFTKWADGMKSASESLNDNIKSGLDAVSNGISDIVTQGKGKFKSLGQAIRAELRSVLKGIASSFIKSSINQLMAGAIKGMNLDSLFGGKSDGGLAAAIAKGQGIVDKANKSIDDAAKTVAEMSVTASVVNIAGVGTLNGANTAGAFNSSGGNPSAVGGITPTPLAPSVPTFGTAAITSPNGLGAIPANSASMFGASLTPALAPIAALATNINAGSSNAGIDANSLASFGQLVNLQNRVQPTAANIGVAPLGDTSASIMKQLMDQGATPKQASTLTAQFAGESNFDPRARAKNDAGTGHYANDSIGLSQWNNGKNNDTINGRKALMMRDVERQTGKPYDSVGTDELRRAQTNYALKEAQTPRYKGAWDSIGQHPGNEGAAFGRRFEGYDSSTAHGDAWRNQKQMELERKANGLQNPKPSAGIDHDPTGSISRTLDPAMKASADTFKKDMEQASKQLSPELTKDFGKDIQAASSATGSATGSSNSGLGDTGNAGNAGGLSGDASGALSSIASLGSGIARLGSQSKVSAQGVASLVPQLASLLAKLASGLGGSLGGAGGAAASAGGGLFGMFKDGGISDSPTASMWIGAPRFADGGISVGGIPSILHPNEAIIPLKNHAVPVDLQGAGQGNVTHNHFNSNTNVTTANADSFRQSRQQIMSEMNKQMARFAARNN
jgi:hypothetical protein